MLDVFQASSEAVHTYDYLFHAYDDGGQFRIAGEFERIDLGVDRRELAEKCPP